MRCFVSVSVCQCVNVSVCQYVNVSVCQCVNVSVCLCVNVSPCCFVTWLLCNNMIPDVPQKRPNYGQHTSWLILLGRECSYVMKQIPHCEPLMDHNPYCPLEIVNRELTENRDSASVRQTCKMSWACLALLV